MEQLLLSQLLTAFDELLSERARLTRANESLQFEIAKLKEKREREVVEAVLVAQDLLVEREAMKQANESLQFKIEVALVDIEGLKLNLRRERELREQLQISLRNKMKTIQQYQQREMQRQHGSLHG